MTYYLVQRLTSKTAPYASDAGFDRFFSLEYMGSSEFEWGAIPKALKAIREKGPVVAEERWVTIGATSRNVYFVGHKGTIDIASGAMEAWAEGGERRPPFWAKESTGFPQAFAGEADSWRHTDAWWAIEEGVAWALDPAIANQLTEAFNSKPKDTK